MTMHLEHLWQAMRTSQVLAEIDGLTQLFGEEHIRREGAPPRIVWVPPDRESFIPRARSVVPLNNPRSLWVRKATVQAHLWGWDARPDATAEHHHTAAESLLQSVIQALQAQMFIGYWYEPEAVEWEKQGDEVLKFGRYCVLLVSMHFPVSDRSYLVKTPNTVTVEPTVTPPEP